MSEIRDVTDVDGRRYRLLDKPLGEGGQGKVFGVRGQPLAVKLLRVNPSPESYDRLRRQLEFVKRLPLNDIPIARPLAMLAAPNLGYVMERMTDMQPLGKLLPPYRCANLVQWYIDSGGLQHRLRLLARCAEAIGQLHRKGIAYGDVSPNNIFVSTAVEEDQVWLIDADNLRYQSSPGSPVLHTPGYGAPEVVCGKGGITSLTDAYSFAVVAFEALSLAHPFRGDVIENGEPELEEQARAGQFPFIDHPTDDRNRSTRGFPRDIVLSEKLQEMAAGAFVDGLHDPKSRPSVSEWARRLFAGADLTLKCRRCHGSFYFRRERCPWCDALRPNHLMLVIKACLVKPDGSREYGRSCGVVAVSVPGSVRLTGRLMNGSAAGKADAPRLDVRIDESGSIFIQSLDGERYRADTRDHARRDWITGSCRRFTQDWYIHLGPEDQSHRVLIFEHS